MHGGERNEKMRLDYCKPVSHADNAEVNSGFVVASGGFQPGNGKGT